MVFAKAVLLVARAKVQSTRLPAIPRAQRQPRDRWGEERGQRHIPHRSGQVGPYPLEHFAAGARIERLVERAIVGGADRCGARKAKAATELDPVPFAQRRCRIGADQEKVVAAAPAELIQRPRLHRVPVEARRDAAGIGEAQRIQVRPPPAPTDRAGSSHLSWVQGEHGGVGALSVHIAQQHQGGVPRGVTGCNQVRVALRVVDRGHLHTGARPIRQAGLEGQAGVRTCRSTLPPEIQACHPAARRVQQFPALGVGSQLLHLKEVSPAQQVGLGHHRFQGDGRSLPAVAVTGSQRRLAQPAAKRVLLAPDDPVEPQCAQLPVRDFAVDAQALRSPAQARTRDALLEEGGQNGPECVVQRAREEGQVPAWRRDAVPQEGVDSVAFTLRRDRAKRRADPPRPGLQSGKRGVPRPTALRSRAPQRKVHARPVESGIAQPLEPVGADVAAPQEEGGLQVALVGDGEGQLGSSASPATGPAERAVPWPLTSRDWSFSGRWGVPPTRSWRK